VIIDCTSKLTILLTCCVKAENAAKKYQFATRHRRYQDHDESNNGGAGFGGSFGGGPAPFGGGGMGFDRSVC